jgi:hypothetical protein
VHFSEPRGVKQAHVFRVLIHIDAKEDLMFYHHPREELIANGKVPWKEFAWHPGHANGELDEDELHPNLQRCDQDLAFQRHRRDDDEGDGDDSHPQNRGFINIFTDWMDVRSRGKEQQSDRGHPRSWFRGESSRRRNREGHDQSLPPSRSSPLPEECRALRQLWCSKGSLSKMEQHFGRKGQDSKEGSPAQMKLLSPVEATRDASDDIVIVPNQLDFSQMEHQIEWASKDALDAIVILPD